MAASKGQLLAEVEVFLQNNKPQQVQLSLTWLRQSLLVSSGQGSEVAYLKQASSPSD